MRWLIILLCFSLSSLHTHAQKGYEKEWKEITQFQEKGLPRSVIDICEKIYQKASAEKNFPEQLRAFLTRMDTRTELDRDSFYTDFSALQEWQAQTTDSLQQSVLAQVVLDKLSAYAEANAYYIRKFKETEELNGENIRTWSKRQFRMRCQQLIDESLRNPSLLAHSSTEPFKGSIELGNGSRYFMHDMLHLAGTHGIKILEKLKDIGFLQNQEFQIESKSIYTYLQNYYAAQGNRSGSLLLSLNQFELRKRFNEISDSIYLQELGTLIEKNRDLEVCAEVYLQKATLLRDQKKRTEALALIDQALERYYRYDRAGALKQLRKEILNPSLFLQLANVAYPREEMNLRVTHRNLQGFTLRLYPLAMDALNSQLSQYTDQNFLKRYGGKPTDLHFNLLSPKDYNEQDTTLHVKAPSNGIYIIEVVPDKETPDHERMLLQVTSLQALNRELPNKDTEIIVVDRKSGYPVPNATLLVYEGRKGEYISTATFKTDTQGRCIIPPQSIPLKIYAQNGKDKALPEFYVQPSNYQFRTDNSSGVKVQLLTDRGLYRPGQTVHVKGIAYQQSGDSSSVVAGQEFTLTLLDANRQEVGSDTLRSNEWGSFTHAFTLPKQTLSGRFQIRCKESSVDIQVEEFKRPSFQVVIDTLQSAPQLGDSVTFTGKAFTFNEFPLQNDSVSYTILREPRYLWRITNDGQTIIASGSTRTNAQGEFSVSFRLKKPESASNEEQVFRFRIQADVTNAAGESQHGESSLVAGNRSLTLSCNLPTEVCKDSVLQVTFRAENLNGTLIPTQGTAQLLTKEGKKVVWDTSFEANRRRSISDWNTLPSGAYLLKVSANDTQGRLCKWEQEVLLFSMHDTRPPVQEPIWSKQFQEFFPENGPAEILFGTNQKQTYVFYTLLNTKKLLESKHLILNDTLIHISLPYKKEYGKGVLLNLCFVKDGQMYQKFFEIKQPFPKKELTLKWDAFRDHLQPGQKEEWRLTIRKPNGQPALAELMATMYDASLDKLYPFNPSFKLYFSRGIFPYQYNWRGGNRYIPSALIEFPFKNYKYPEFVYDHWNFFTLYQVISSRRTINSEFKHLSIAGIDDALPGRIGGLNLTATGLSRNMGKAAKADFANSPVQETEMAYQKTSKEESAFDQASQTPDSYIEPDAYVRQNFNETAFFYPQLYTNEQGEVSLSFTLPDALTKWRFIGIAQTKDVMTGMLESYATSSKPFMLTTQLPRYLRQGDITDLGGLIRNVSGKTVDGFVKCEIFDPQTNKILKQFRQPFHLANDSTQAVSFRLEPLKNIEFVGIRMVADGGTFSDGEQHLLAVLSNKSRLVESIPLSLRGNGSKEYSLAPLFNHHSPTATDRKITVEMTVNPSWMAVQALPYLNVPTNENALSYATAYYANTLSGWIVSQNPTLKQALEAWKATSAPAQSNLQRNPELQELLLQETPWVQEAQNEAQQRAKLVTLTETNTLNYQRNEMLRKLRELQLADGSFPWFKGMFPSYSTTAYVLETLSRLTALTEKKEDPLPELIRKNAYNYIQNKMTEAYERITKKNEYKLSEQDLNYLYICTLVPEEIPASARKAHQFYLNALRPSLTGLSLFGRATAALVLLHEGRKTEAEEFYRSLKQYTTGTEDMGAYYANLNGLGSPTLTLTRAIEAAQAMGDTTLVNDFKINLLRQKQTQIWDSPVSTANAVYALLKGEKSLTSGAGECSVTLGKQVIRCEPKAGDINALMGYTKVSLTGKETEAKTATFTHTGNGICWGAIYGECMEFLDRIQQQGVQVQVNKEFFVKQEQPGGFIWKQVTASTHLQKGDLLMTRLTVTTDRDLDFVTLKDQRAACLEPVQPLSGYRFGGYYLEQEDASSILFFDRLTKGSHVFELENYITLSGTYNGGMAQLQSAYATEFTGHSGTSTLVVE